jgi:hypothetical protein
LNGAEFGAISNGIGGDILQQLPYVTLHIILIKRGHFVANLVSTSTLALEKAA